MKHLKRLLFWGILLSLLGLIISAFFVLSLYSGTNITEKDCAVVFGAAVWRDDKPSHALYDRTIAAHTLYEEGLVTCIVLSGGASTYGAHESDVMAKILKENGVPERALVYDYNGTNTKETIAHLDPSQTYTLVSNDFHLARISLLAHQRGLDAFNLYPASYINGRYVKELQFFGHEVFGTIYYFFYFDGIAAISKGLSRTLF